MTDRKFAFYCTCGAAMTGAVSPYKNADELERIFWSLHAKPGHEPTNQRTAASARRRADRSAA